MFGLGLGELALIFGILLLLFGGRKLPEIAGGIGGAIKTFRNSLKDTGSEETATKTLPGEKAEDNAQT
ncbi:MAG: twin-arginine translocase TatA/TatE family subunit [Myxococcales bacterium]|nr:twin-arginine translocase TatA/TatE family subunit [Myxococcales bacterium]|tara:strand:+ start:496 stop:699 length:204 start_codon:yes stop_codon:yes gene_type:complete